MQLPSLALVSVYTFERNAIFQAQEDSTLFFIGLVSAVSLIVGIVIGLALFRLWQGNNPSRKKDELTSIQESANQGYRERMHAIYNLVSTLSSSLNYQRVLDSILDLSIHALATQGSPSDRLVSAVFLFSNQGSSPHQLSVVTARGLSTPDTRLLLPGSEGVIRLVIDEGVPVLTRGIANDPELSRIIALQACHSAYCLPLRSGLETYGFLLFAHPERDYFSPERVEVLDIISHQAAIAIQNARLYMDLEQEKERILEIQEEARKKLARDLHDGPTQTISAIAMRVNFARRLADKDVQAALDELVKIEDLARSTTREIRHMLFTLRPLVLESQGLVAALETMAVKMGETYHQNVLITAAPDVASNLEMSKQAIIFYIVEEAVNNARKHAQAQHIWVRLTRPQKDLVLTEIEDDGVGFNLEKTEAIYDQKGSLGLVNMRERAELVNGLIEIQAKEGQGVCIRVVIPLTEAASERIHNWK